MEKPFDPIMVEAMLYTTKSLCESIQGCVLGYTQSDEISLILTDFNDIKTEAFFNGNIQKIASVSASFATAFFNDYMGDKIDKLAFFDSRVFIIPSAVEVENYLIWRQRDCTKNSISSLAQSLYSHKQLLGKHSNDKKEMCRETGIPWEDLDEGLKNGYLITKEVYGAKDTDGNLVKVNRCKWIPNGAFIFPKERERLTNLIPRQ